MEVKVGQIWTDNDWRDQGRTIRVESIDGDHAIVVVVSMAKWRKGTLLNSLGRRTKIRLDRFRPTSNGYKFVFGPSEEP